MARTVSWTESAVEDLNEVARFIARDSQYYAASFVKEVLFFLKEEGLFQKLMKWTYERYLLKAIDLFIKLRLKESLY